MESNLIHLLSSSSPIIKEKAAGALWNLALNNDNQIAIGKEGGIKPLILLLFSSGSRIMKEKALMRLAKSSDNQVIIEKEGGMHILMRLIRTTSGVTKEMAVGALRHLLANGENQAKIEN